LQGDLSVQLKGWRLAGYSGHLTGDNFQTLYLPELQMATSPRLTFQGDGATVTVRGEVRVPQLLVSGPPVRPTVAPSSDVILEGAQGQPAVKKYALTINGLVHVALGDKGKVQVKASGIDATLGGEMDLDLKGLENITSTGEIKVVKGKYRAYGVDLDIVRGRMYYAKTPVTQPTLDILALKTVGDVKAGVTVAGYLRAPVIKLYSEPSMADVDVLSYVVLGHPLSSGVTGSEQASTLAMAASGLFSFGEGESMQDQLQQRLGLSVLGMQTVTPSTSGLMGYQQVNVTPTGAAAKAAPTESLMTVGKYITPKLYVSYGRSLVTGGSLVLLRYDILHHWQIETQSGSESGADLYYKLEFD
jgi:translocation and assembly module TamB